MAKSNHYLIAGGVMSTFISILHIVLAIYPTLYRYIWPGQSALTEMAEQGSSVTTIASVALALIFAIWAIYAFSGAGLIRPLPLLRAALIANHENAVRRLVKSTKQETHHLTFLPRRKSCHTEICL